MGTFFRACARVTPTMPAPNINTCGFCSWAIVWSIVFVCTFSRLTLVSFQKQAGKQIRN